MGLMYFSVNFQDLKWGLNVMFEVRLDDGMMTDHQARTLVHALDHDGSGGKSKKSLENSLHMHLHRLFWLFWSLFVCFSDRNHLKFTFTFTCNIVVTDY